MAWVVEITGRDLPNAATADETLMFSLGAGIAFTDADYASGDLLSWDSVTQSIAVAADGTVKSVDQTGQLVIANITRDIAEDGPWGHLLNWGWQGRVARLYRVIGQSWSAKTLCATGTLEQPNASGGTIIFALRDPRAVLDAPFQTTKFAGDNVAPLGVEGTADLKGKPKPICYGTVSNVPGVLVNFSKSVWMVADKAATILCVRDGSAPLLVGTTIRANVASLLANTPVPGGYDYCTGSDGTYVRLGAGVIDTITFDVQEGLTEADRTHAQIWSRIRTERCGTDSADVSSASIAAMDLATPNEVGFWWDGETTRRDALDKVLTSLSGFEVQSLAGVWSIGRLATPSGTPALRLVMVSDDEDFAMKPTDRALTGEPEPVRPAYAPDGAPPYRVNEKWGRNHTVLPAAQQAGAAAQRLKDKFSVEFRVETATDTAIWNPVDGTGAFPNAPELTIETGYQPGDDTLTCPHAAAEASRLLALYGSLPIKGQYQVGFVPEPGDQVLPGTVIGMVFPRYGLDTGPLFIALQGSFKVDAAGAAAGLILGLQT